MKRCPHCTQAIQDDVVVCPLCKANVLSTAAPAWTPPQEQVTPAQAVSNPAANAETSGKAIGSLIFGIIGFVLLPLISSVPAIILGHLSLSEIKKSAGRLKGQGLAIAGLVMGYLSVAMLPFILIVAAIAIPNLLRARMAANEASAVGSLRLYNTALMAYASECPNVGYPASVKNLGPGKGNCDAANLVDAMLGSTIPEKNGYRFSYAPGPADSSGHILSYTINADPISENATGTRHFFADESGAIRMSQGRTATADSPRIN